MKEIIIPFDGFYESITDSLIDDVIELETYNREEDNQPPFDHFVVNFEAIASAYVSRFTTYLKDEYELDIQLTFKDLKMPKEYNFTTDLICCEIDEQNLIKLHAWALDNINLQKAVYDMFSSRDGFVSFYTEFVEEWQTKPVLQWDHNELTVLFPEIDFMQVWQCDNGNEVFYNNVHFIEAIQS